MKLPVPPGRLAAWLFVLAACHAATAATYYSDPAAGTAGGDGSAGAPWPKLQDAPLSKLQGGDTLLLRSGYHGDVKISGDNTQFITIAAEPGQTPQLSRLEITRGSKWLVRGLTISPSFAPAPYKDNMVTLGEGGKSSELVLEDCFLYTALDSSKWTAAEWMNANSGVFLGRNGTHLTMRNNYILNTRFAISLCSPDSLCEGNIVANFSADGIRITRDGITVQYNTVRNAYVDDTEGDNNHDDLVQCFLFNVGTGTLRRDTLRGNILIGNEDPHQPHPNTPQGVGFFDGPLVDFVVEQNVVLTNHYHGISLYDAVNCKILDNAVKAASVQKMMPWILISTQNVGGSKGNVVRNNMAHSFDLKADPEVVSENNVPVTDDAFNRRFQEQLGVINGKFGEFHPVAKLSRIGMKTGEYKAPAP